MIRSGQFPLFWPRARESSRAAIRSGFKKKKPPESSVLFLRGRSPRRRSTVHENPEGIPPGDDLRRDREKTRRERERLTNTKRKIDGQREGGRKRDPLRFARLHSARATCPTRCFFVVFFIAAHTAARASTLFVSQRLVHDR